MLTGDNIPTWEFPIVFHSFRFRRSRHWRSIRIVIVSLWHQIRFTFFIHIYLCKSALTERNERSRIHAKNKNVSIDFIQKNNVFSFKFQWRIRYQKWSQQKWIYEEKNLFWIKFRLKFCRNRKMIFGHQNKND